MVLHGALHVPSAWAPWPYLGSTFVAGESGTLLEFNEHSNIVLVESAIERLAIERY